MTHDDQGVRVTPPCAGEISALDCATGEYLVEAPDALPAGTVANDQPEDLFFIDPKSSAATRLFVGSDRPQILATTRDLRFAWIGEMGSTTQVLDLTTGIPQAIPAEPDLDEAHEQLHIGEGEDDDEWGYGAAVMFREGQWHFLWNQGLYANHLAERPLRIVPAVQAGAFDPSGTLLAVIVGMRIAIIDIDERKLVRTFPLP